MTQTINKTRKQTEIQAASIARVSDKSGKFLGYLVKSNSSENYYEVTYNESASRYECSCIATCKCCHIKAVEQVQAARVENSKQGNSPAATPETRVVQAYGNAGMGFYAEQCVDGQWVRFPDAETGKDVCHPRKGSAETFLSTYSLVDAAANMRVFYSEW